MKRQSEKPPIDDLFARKLGNMSLPPGADAFEQLQARMNQQEPTHKLVFWRNPVVQRYMAAAACLLLVCLVGWQYWSADGVKPANQVALSNKPLHSPTIQERLAKQSERKPQPVDQVANQTTSQPVSPGFSDRDTKKIKIAQVRSTDSKANKGADTKETTVQNNRPLVAINKTTGSTDKVAKAGVLIAEKPTVMPNQEQPAVTSKPQEQVAQIAAKAAPTSERVLTVTIAEPASLVASQVEIKVSAAGKASLASTEKEETKASTKIGNLWQQVKRVKAGDALVSRANTNDERGLLGRAYSELRQTLDKDKSLKQ